MARQIQLKKSGKVLTEKIEFLREVTAALLDEVKALVPLKTVDVRNGINFDDEVTRFEIFLIERALEQTGGRQLQAARLLNIKHTTLNAKIKRFQISLARIRAGNGTEANGDVPKYQN